ncbi:MAG TPA: DUF3109 family protein [Bacteroidales bacterium]|nr:DUF3109 family protein [Bacteroidales bacterium]
MIQIGNTLISLDILEKKFICDITKCKGICCVEGDSGAPLTDDETKVLSESLPQIEPFLDSVHVEILKKQGVFYIDHEGEKVTTLVNNAECAFVVKKDGVLFCGIELAYKQGLVSIPKPISCHLYPIRCKQYRDFEALNYDTWYICKDAVNKGNNEGVALYQFLKAPLIRKYGEQWYAELEMIAHQWKRSDK